MWHGGRQATVLFKGSQCGKHRAIARRLSLLMSTWRTLCNWNEILFAAPLHWEQQACCMKVWIKHGRQRERNKNSKEKTGQKEKHTSKLWVLRKCWENIDYCGGIQQDDKNWAVRSLESTIHSDHEVYGLQFPLQYNKVRPVPTVHTWSSIEVCEVLHQIITAMG